MAKEIEWGIIHGEGEVVCTCDKCDAEERFEFEDGCFDFKKVSQELRNLYGWISRKINGEWYDFCSKECYDNFIRKGQAR